MRKLMLNVEALVVESFETSESRRAAGTVHAHETFESECRCVSDSCKCGSVESCTACGCDTPGFTCEERCYPPVTDVKVTVAQAAGVLIGD